VAEAENGQLALDVARGSSFDLVLADVNMPVMDGIAMVRELRAMDAYKGVPILMLTTESHTEKKMEGKAAGATGWLVKPFDPEQLLATVKRVLG
jgi:two-component system chemotaxis response regulator CheY